MRIFLILGVVTLHMTMSNAMAVTPSLDSLNTVTRSVNTFSNKLFQKIAESESGNVICSPLSVSMVLSMALYGARGETEMQLRSALELPADDDLTKNGIQSLVDSFSNYTEVELRLANKIFLALSFKPKTEFMGVTNEVFRSEAQGVDFEKSVDASKTINQWCEEKTNNRIKDLIKPDDLNAATALVLVNAVYFKGDWAMKFDPSETEPRPFHVNENTSKNVSTMFRHGSYRYGELPQVDAKFIELPYKSKSENDSMSMIIILPNRVNGLTELENNFDKVSMDELLSGRKTDVNVYLPKFKIESTINLEDSLEKLGLGDMFTSKANFTGIVDAPPLTVSKVVQKAFIEVNEEGSEAAAATGLIVAVMSMPLPSFEIDFVVDRPFVSMIVTKQPQQHDRVVKRTAGGAILFQAVVVDPTSH